jgi:membrane fusion protein (multidrug efflux system)
MGKHRATLVANSNGAAASEASPTCIDAMQAAPTRGHRARPKRTSSGAWSGQKFHSGSWWRGMDLLENLRQAKEVVVENGPARGVVRRRIAAVALLALAGCDEGAETGAEVSAPPPAVVVAPAVMREVAGEAEFVGRSEAVAEVAVRARVQGFLIERPFTEGETVTAGDLLFVIEPAEFEAAAKAARATLNDAQAAYKVAASETRRARDLLEKGGNLAITEAEVERREGEAERAQAAIEAAEAALRQAELNLGYTRIETPITGRIGASGYDVGNLIGPDSGVLASVVSLDPVYVSFPVSEQEYLAYLKAEEQPTIVPRLRLADRSMYAHEGEIEFVDNRVDPTTGTIRVRAEFPNPESLLLPGQFVNVLLTAGEPEERVVVPQAAVQQNQSGPFVLVVGEDNRVTARPIRTGARLGPDLVVEEGLEAGETVIVQGLQKVRPGGEVNPTPLGEEASPEATAAIDDEG